MNNGSLTTTTTTTQCSGTENRKHRPPRWWQYPVNKVYIPPIPKSPEKSSIDINVEDQDDILGPTAAGVTNGNTHNKDQDIAIQLSTDPKKKKPMLREELKEHKVYKSCPRKFNPEKFIQVEFLEMDNDGYVFLKIQSELEQHKDKIQILSMYFAVKAEQGQDLKMDEEDIEIGLIVVGHDSGKYMRVKITSVFSIQEVVKGVNVDSGDEVYIPFSELFYLPLSFWEDWPFQSIKCQLRGLEFFLGSQALVEAHKRLQISRFHLYAQFVEEIDLVWSVILVDRKNNEKVKSTLNELVEEFFVTEKKDIKNMTAETKLDSMYICHAEDNGDIWLQFMSPLVHKLSDMGTVVDLQNFKTEENFKQVRRQLSEGKTIFIAAYTDDKLYRVFVLGFSETRDHVYVRFMEYGNIEEIHMDSLIPCSLFSKILLKIPPQCFRAHLRYIGWLNCDEFYKLVPVTLTQEFIVKEVRKGMETIPVVDAYVFKGIEDDEPLLLNTYILQNKIATLEPNINIGNVKSAVKEETNDNEETTPSSQKTDELICTDCCAGKDHELDAISKSLVDLPNVWSLNDLKIL